ncbi:hypothetical protein ACDX78_13475 [Virgibacillus oceani]
MTENIQVTKRQVKDALGIKDDSKDKAVEAWIPIVYDYLKGYVGWSDITVIKMIQYNMEHRPGISAESLSRHSINFLHSFPPSITNGLGRKL